MISFKALAKMINQSNTEKQTGNTPLLILLKQRIWFLSFILFPSFLFSQSALTYYEHIKPIVDRNCVVCHRPGQAAPFPLQTYEEVYKRVEFIKMVVESGYMPPWHADTAFNTFHNQHLLTTQQIKLIGDWIGQGAQAGVSISTLNRIEAPVYPSPDLVIKLNQPFTIPGNNTEQYRIFVMPSQAKKDLYVRGVDFVPGNKKLAHHARIMLDTTNKLRPDDGIEIGQSSAFAKLNVQLANKFWHGWVPGSFSIFYPEGTGKLLPKNADLVLNMHYAPSPKPAEDQSEVHIYLASEKPRRLIQTLVLDENWIFNQPFKIAADTVITYYMRSPIIPQDLSLVSVMPHMHLLGKSFKAYAITPEGDLIPLIHIPAWDFNWQRNYQFKNLIKLPKGSVIYAEAVYDNTKNNPRNPFVPPRESTYGWGTTNEMMNLIFEYLDYEIGDEYWDVYH
jgi:hypothetical protein